MKVLKHTRVNTKSHDDIIDATKPLKFSITEAHSWGGKPTSRQYCVLACALKSKVNSEGVVDTGTDIVRGQLATVDIGPCIIKLWVRKNPQSETIIRYCPSSILVKAIRAYDKTKNWNLPIGVYELKPVSAGLTLGNPRNKNGKWEGYQGKKKKRISGTPLLTKQVATQSGRFFHVY